MTMGGSAQPAVLLPGAVQVQRHLGKSFPFFSYFRVEKKIPRKSQSTGRSFAGNTSAGKTAACR